METLLLGKEVRHKIKSGVDKVADIVKLTMGSKGKLVMIEDPAFDDIPHVTKDGARVARHVSSSCPYEQMAIKVVNNSARKVANKVGDGTTTTTVLIQALLDEAIKSKKDVKTLSWEYTRATEYICNLLTADYSKEFSYKTMLYTVNISTNGDYNLSNIVTECFEQVGRYGVVKVVEELNGVTRHEFETGFRIDSGYITEKFMSHETSLSYSEPYVLILRDSLEDITLISDSLEQVARDGRPVIIFAPNFSDEVVGALLFNHLNKTITVNTIRLPEFGDKQEDIIQDLVKFTGATPNTKFETADFFFGEIKEAVINGEKTTLMADVGDSYTEYCDEFKAKIRNEKDPFLKDFLMQRYGNMTSKVATIYLGERDEVIMKESKDRLDDAIGSARSCYSGILPGGGNALASMFNQASSVSAEFGRALLAPRNQIMRNAGIELKWQEPSDFNTGYSLHEFDDRDKFKVEKDLIKKGVIDPTLVVTESLKAATDAVTMLLRTGGMILTK